LLDLVLHSQEETVLWIGSDNGYPLTEVPKYLDKGGHRIGVGRSLVVRTPDMAAAPHNLFSALPASASVQASIANRFMTGKSCTAPIHDGCSGAPAAPDGITGIHSPDTFSFASSTTPMPVQTHARPSQFLETVQTTSLPPAQQTVPARSASLIGDSQIIPSHHVRNATPFFGGSFVAATGDARCDSNIAGGDTAHFDAATSLNLVNQARQYQLQNEYADGEARRCGAGPFDTLSHCLTIGEILTNENSPAQAAVHPSGIEPQAYLFQQQLQQQMYPHVRENIYPRGHQQYQQNRVQISGPQQPFNTCPVDAPHVDPMWESAPANAFEALHYQPGESVTHQNLGGAFCTTSPRVRRPPSKSIQKPAKARRFVAAKEPTSVVAAMTKVSPQGGPNASRKPRTYARPTPSQHCHVCSRRPTEASPHSACGNLTKGKCRKTICEKCLIQYGWPVEIARDAKHTGWVCPHCDGKCPDRAQCHIYDRTSERRRNKTVNHRKPKANFVAEVQGQHTAGVAKSNVVMKKRKEVSRMKGCDADRYVVMDSGSPECKMTAIGGVHSFALSPQFVPVASCKYEGRISTAVKTRRAIPNLVGSGDNTLAAYIEQNDAPSAPLQNLESRCNDFFDGLLDSSEGHRYGSRAQAGIGHVSPGVISSSVAIVEGESPCETDLLKDFMDTIVNSNAAQASGEHDQTFNEQSPEVNLGFMTSFGDGEELDLGPGTEYVGTDID
jgi:hypothetical protein